MYNVNIEVSLTGTEEQVEINVSDRNNPDTPMCYGGMKLEDVPMALEEVLNDYLALYAVGGHLSLVGSKEEEEYKDE